MMEGTLNLTILPSLRTAGIIITYTYNKVPIRFKIVFLAALKVR